MKLIAHRGNTLGPDSANENKLYYITKALRDGFDVEVDVRIETYAINNYKVWLGHDRGDYPSPILNS